MYDLSARIGVTLRRRAHRGVERGVFSLPEKRGLRNPRKIPNFVRLKLECFGAFLTVF